MLDPRLDDGDLAGLVGASREGRRLLRDVVRAAHRRTAALITGPRGSGKQAVARAIHALSEADGPLALLEAASWPERDHADRLVGSPDHPGLWTTADGGTLVIRDVESLAEDAQLALVQLLDTGRGPRVLALSRAPLARLDLSAALLHRLALCTIDVPDLHSRGVDIELIAEHHLGRLGPDEHGEPWVLTTEAALALRRYPWPGNVRELLRVVERACHTAGHGPLRAAHLDLRILPAPQPSANLADMERAAVARALDAHDGNVTEAGRALGVPRSTLYRKLKKWGMR